MFQNIRETTGRSGRCQYNIHEFHAARFTYFRNAEEAAGSSGRWQEKAPVG